MRKIRRKLALLAEGPGKPSLLSLQLKAATSKKQLQIREFPRRRHPKAELEMWDLEFLLVNAALTEALST